MRGPARSPVDAELLRPALHGAGLRPLQGVEVGVGAQLVRDHVDPGAPVALEPPGVGLAPGVVAAGGDRQDAALEGGQAAVDVRMEPGVARAGLDLAVHLAVHLALLVDDPEPVDP